MGFDLNHDVFLELDGRVRGIVVGAVVPKPKDDCSDPKAFW